MESHSRSAVVVQLEQEWPLLARRDLSVALARWRETQPALRRFQRTEDLLAFMHGATAHESDAPLLALLVLAGDDRDAGRFVRRQSCPPSRRRHDGSQLARQREMSCGSCSSSTPGRRSAPTR